MGVWALSKAALEELFVKPRMVRWPGVLRRVMPLMTERAFQRFINYMAAVFLLALAIGAAIQLTFLHRAEKTRVDQQAAMALRLAGLELSRALLGTDHSATPRMPSSRDIARALKGVPQAMSTGHVWLVLDAGGTVRARWPGEALPEVTGQLAAHLPAGALNAARAAGQARLARITLPDGMEISAGSVPLSPWPGTLVVLRPVDAGMQVWRKSAWAIAGLFLLCASVIIALASAFNWQAARAAQADTTLAVATSRLDAALDQGRCGLWDWDVARGRIFWSRSMYSMLGVQAAGEYLSFGEIAARQHPQDLPLDQMVEAMLKEGRDSFDHEFRLRHASGHWVWLRARGAMTRGANASEPHLVGIAIDITAQKKADKASREAETRLREAIEAISESFVLWDGESRLVMCNSKYQQFHSLPPSVCQPGMAYEEVMKAARKPKVAKRHSILSDENDEEVIFEVQLDDGRWLQINERRVRDKGFVSVGTDITDLKRQQEELKRSEAELKATVAELENSRYELEQQRQRLADLANKYMMEKEKAEAAYRTKSAFLANMSHELRTPLNPIIGFAQVMRQQIYGPLHEKYLECAADIEGSARHLLDLVSDILDMSKIEAGKERLNPRDMDLAEAVAGSVSLIAEQARANGLTLEVAAPESLPWRADPLKIKQVLLNILSNAVKFTGPGGRVRLEMHELPGQVRISISDTGVGIAEEHLDKLGKPFEQVGGGFTARKGGSGLGLAISRSLVEMHGGTLEITSRLGEGTTVTVTLPGSPARTSSPKQARAS